MSAYTDYLQDRRAELIPSLKDFYAEDFLVGAAIVPAWLEQGDKRAALLKHFNSLTAENVMKPESLLDRSATLAAGSQTRAVYNFQPMAGIMNFARDHHIPVRFHVLVWHNQTPRWFFARDWSNAPDAPLVDRETLLERMKNAIADEMDYVNATWPGVVYCWDVVNEAIEPDHQAPNMFRTNSCYYQILGEDLVPQAFRFARAHQAEGQKLFYNDFNMAQENKTPWVYRMVRQLCEEGLVDGVGFQTHIGLDYPDFAFYEQTVRDYAALGLAIQATEMDVRVNSASPADQMRLAVRYRDYFAMMRRLRREGLNIESVTLWGLTDDQSWLMGWKGPSYPLLFDGELKPKPAFFGALLDEAIPATLAEVKLPETLPPATPLKSPDHHNPVMTQRFGADPWALVYHDRVYLYMTGDAYRYAPDGTILPNNYSNIQCLRCVSSLDLVNWTDHGDILVAGPNGPCAWAHHSWAPCAAWKKIDGRDRFFLYFADSANGIGVLTADTPIGPFRDPIGGPLVSRKTPNCDTVTWLFDPAVLLTEDGQGYLYFGGGVPEGRAKNPGTARCVALGEDMVSLKGEVRAIEPPYLFEDSGINQVGDTFVYSYCTNFSVGGDPDVPFGSGEICTMRGKSPLGPFTFGESVLKNPGHFFGAGGNNHHCIFQFRGKWYIAYHTQALEKALGNSQGYRNVHIDAIAVDEAGHFAPATGTLSGVPQAIPLDPYQYLCGATAATVAGVTMKVAPTCGMGLYTLVPQAWTMVAGAAFGSVGAKSLAIRYQAVCDGTVSIVLDDVHSDPVAVLPLQKSRWRHTVFELPTCITGTHDVYLLFSAPAMEVSCYRFI